MAIIVDVLPLKYLSENIITKLKIKIKKPEDQEIIEKEFNIFAFLEKL